MRILFNLLSFFFFTISNKKRGRKKRESARSWLLDMHASHMIRCSLGVAATESIAQGACSAVNPPFWATINMGAMIGSAKRFWQRNGWFVICVLVGICILSYCSVMSFYHQIVTECIVFNGPLSHDSGGGGTGARVLFLSVPLRRVR